MASATPRRRPFARFDDEPQDSNRTFSAAPRPLRSMRAGSAAAAASGARESFRHLGTGSRRRPLQESAFFLETTDDDERSLAQAWRTAATASAKAADRRVLAAPAVVSSSQVLPRFLITAAVAKTLYSRHQKAAAAGTTEAPTCFVRGEPIVPSQRRVRVVQVTNEKGAEQSPPGAWWIPVFFMTGPDPCFSKEEYVAAIKKTQHAYADECSDSLAPRLQPRLVVSPSSDHAAQLEFQLEFLFSPLLLKFSLIRNLPLLMTPLAASLARREFGTGVDARRSGYLTLDRTRKAVPLLKADPLVFQQPIVGVWVYGVDMDEEWDDETARVQLADPYLYLACLHYLTARSVKERVQLAANTFLVALYPSADAVNGRTVSPLPRFFECSFSERVRVSDLLPMELYAQRKACFAGLSRFSDDVELTPVPTSNAAWESAKRELDIPVIPREPRPPAHLDVMASEDIPGDSIANPRREEASTASQPGEPTVNLRSDLAARSSRSEPAGNGSSLGLSGSKKRSELVQRAAEMGTVGGDLETAAVSDSSALDVSDLSSKASESFNGSAKESQVLSPKTTTASAGQADREVRRRSRRLLETRHPNNLVLDPANCRSCCKSQQLLAIQHQQILENQQRQLQEMQEQIAQLRRLLEATTKTTAGAERPLDQTDNEGGNIGGKAAMPAAHGRGGDDGDTSRRWNHVGSEISRLSASLDSLSRAVGTSSVNEDAKSESGSSLSSLELSSISNGSAGSGELSSLSSSVTRSRTRSATAGRAGAVQRSKSAEGGDLLGDLSASLASSHSVKSTSQTNAHADVSPSGIEQAALAADEADEAVDAVNLEPADEGAGDEAQVPKPVESPPDDIEDTDRGPMSSSIPGIELPRAADGNDDEDDDNASMQPHGSHSPFLLLPDAYLKQKGPLFDHHGGCFTAPTPDLHSFCVPRIRFSLDDRDATAVAGRSFLASDSDSDDDLRLIEQKYRRLMAA